MPFQSNDPQTNGPQYLEDLATGYWYSEALFTAVDLGIFTLLEPEGKKLAEIAGKLGLEQAGLQRFLEALCALGLLDSYGKRYSNTRVSREFLIKGRENYQGDSVLWRKNLFPNWRSLRRCLKKGGRVRFAKQEEGREQLVRRIRRYGRAMGNVAASKAKEILPILTNLSLTGEILDVGSGPGTISAGLLAHFPAARATLMDIPEVLDYARELLEKSELSGRLDYYPANILLPWQLEKDHFDLIILSNIVHAYSEGEIIVLLAKAVACLKPGGLMLIHDFFLEHCREKAALFDLNMFVNTFNGKVFTAKWVQEQLELLNLSVSELLPLASDTALIFAAKEAQSLQNLCLDRNSRLMAKIRKLGFHSVNSLTTEDIQIPNWVDLRCRYGCANYGKPHCPPNSLSPQKTREMLAAYSHCLLLEGTPPTGDFQRLVLQAEKEAFAAGCYKAIAFWAGPCSLCEKCRAEEGCCQSRDARLSMEGAGIDVFATVQRAGIALRTLADRGDYVKYFAIVLLE
jgi:predicted metal-binding protein/2-polyprenyl-3-methyl-5-hydroxy-6-metoxy-1,4-benzoquinol methylase